MFERHQDQEKKTIILELKYAEILGDNNLIRPFEGANWRQTALSPQSTSALVGSAGFSV